MKFMVGLPFICLFYQTMNAQNFTGEIKYTITSISPETQDTITYFFDKNSVLIKFPKGAVERGGHPYGIYYISYIF